MDAIKKFFSNKTNIIMTVAAVAIVGVIVFAIVWNTKGGNEDAATNGGVQGSAITDTIGGQSSGTTGVVGSGDSQTGNASAGTETTNPGAEAGNAAENAAGNAAGTTTVTTNGSTAGTTTGTAGSTGAGTVYNGSANVGDSQLPVMETPIINANGEIVENPVEATGETTGGTTGSTTGGTTGGTTDNQTGTKPGVIELPFVSADKFNNSSYNGNNETPPVPVD